MKIKNNFKSTDIIKIQCSQLNLTIWLIEWEKLLNLNEEDITREVIIKMSDCKISEGISFAGVYKEDNNENYISDLNANIEGFKSVVTDYKNKKITKKEFVWQTQYMLFSIGMFMKILSYKRKKREEITRSLLSLI